MRFASATYGIVSNEQSLMLCFCHEVLTRLSHQRMLFSWFLDPGSSASGIAMFSAKLFSIKYTDCVGIELMENMSREKMYSFEKLMINMFLYIYVREFCVKYQDEILTKISMLHFNREK